MRATTGIFLLLTVASGCAVDGFRSSARDRPVQRVPPAPVSADQVHLKNAHEQALAAWDELDYEETKLGTDKKDAKVK